MIIKEIFKRAEWLGMEVRDETNSVLSPELITALCLFEMILVKMGPYNQKPKYLSIASRSAFCWALPW